MMVIMKGYYRDLYVYEYRYETITKCMEQALIESLCETYFYRRENMKDMLNM